MLSTWALVQPRVTSVFLISLCQMELWWRILRRERAADIFAKICVLLVVLGHPRISWYQLFVCSISLIFFELFIQDVNLVEIWNDFHLFEQMLC